MIVRGVIVLGLTLALALGDARAQATTQVQVLGAVAHPGTMTLSGASRLGDVMKQQQVEPGAYILGAAWLRPSLRPEQIRLKAGLVYELGEIRSVAAAKGNASLTALATRLRNSINAMPVTGRQMTSTLEPHAVQVTPAANLPVQDGDVLFYPARPDDVQVVGAVEQPCALPHAGLKSARNYAIECRHSPHSDPDVLYVIEPDGRVYERGIGLWNSSPAIPVAPGAVIYVPLAKRAIEHVADETFNREMADFLATQPVGRAEGLP